MANGFVSMTLTYESEGKLIHNQVRLLYYDRIRKNR